jgi:hypothetical protein
MPSRISQIAWRSSRDTGQRNRHSGENHQDSGGRDRVDQGEAACMPYRSFGRRFRHRSFANSATKIPEAAFESGSLKRTLADRANRTLASVAGHTSIVRGGLLPTEPQRRRWTLSSGVPMSSPAEAKSFQSFTIIPLSYLRGQRWQI